MPGEPGPKTGEVSSVPLLHTEALRPETTRCPVSFGGMIWIDAAVGHTDSVPVGTSEYPTLNQKVPPAGTVIARGVTFSNDRGPPRTVVV